MTEVGEEKEEVKEILRQNRVAVFTAAVFLSLVVSVFTVWQMLGRADHYEAEALFPEELSDTLSAAKDAEIIGDALAGSLKVSDPGEFSDPSEFTDLYRYGDCTSTWDTCSLTLYGWRKDRAPIYYVTEAKLEFEGGRHTFTGYQRSELEFVGNRLSIEWDLTKDLVGLHIFILVMLRSVLVFILGYEVTGVWRNYKLRKRDPYLHSKVYNLSQGW